MRGLEVQPYYMLVADAPPNTAPKKILTPEPKFAVVAISHVKGEFRYESGMVELCLCDFNGPSLAFFGGTSFLSNIVIEIFNYCSDTN